MNDEFAIEVSHLRKSYKLFKSPKQRMLYELFGVGGKNEHTAIDDITFQVKKGESFAIIGKNGSGKSTLLQILAGILKKTAGEVNVCGRIAPLLELGSGFDPNSSGYENIYMNAAILGVEKKDIDARVQEIISFADIGEYINQPVKTYSSGMFIRLGFSVAINVDADILLVDEALAVGDIFFRQKCYAKLNQLKQKGTTIILVTHNMSEVESFCDRAIYLKDGKIASEGDSSFVVQRYYYDNQTKSASSVKALSQKHDKEKVLPKQDQNYGIAEWHVQQKIFFDISTRSPSTDGSAEYVRIGLFDADGNAARNFQQGDDAYFYMELRTNREIGVPIHSVIIQDQKGMVVHGKDTIQGNEMLPKNVPAQQNIVILHRIKLDFAEGEYSFSVGLGSVAERVYQSRQKYIQEELHSLMQRHCTMTKVGSFAIRQRDIGAPTRMLFHGLCDVPTKIYLKTDDQ